MYISDTKKGTEIMSQETELLFKSNSTFSISGTIAESLDKRSTRDEDCSTWNTATSGKVCTLMRDGIYAIEAYISAKAGKPVRDCAVLKVSNILWSAEYAHTTTASTDVVIYNTSNGVLEAANVKGNQYVQLPKYGSKTDPRSIASILFAMIPAFCEANPEFAKDLATMEAWYADPATHANPGKVTWTDDADHAIHRICDAFYRGLKDDRLPIASMSMGDIPAVARARVRSKAYDGEVIVGTPTILSGTTAKASKTTAVKTIKVAMAKYDKVRQANLALLTEAEKILVPTFDDDVVVPDYVFDIIDEYVDTLDGKEPVNSVRIEGPTGHGKTVSSRQIACILGLMYRSQNFNPDSDRMEIKEGIVPNTTGAGAKPVSGFVKGKPSMEDMVDDPVYAYEQITGVEKMDVTSKELQDAYDAAMESSIKTALNAPKEDPPQFVHVLSELMQAIQRPCVIELQEISRARPGVLSGNNEIFDRDAVIHCESTGETFKRDPRSIIISTDNVDYPGCKKLSPDVRRRFAHIERLRPLEKQDAVARVMQRVGFTDKKVLEQMWEIVNATADYCRVNNITDGDVGLTELMFWAQLIQKGRDKSKSFRTAVLNKATGNNETADEVWNAVKISAAAGKFFD